MVWGSMICLLFSCWKVFRCFCRDGLLKGAAPKVQKMQCGWLLEASEYVVNVFDAVLL